MSFRDYGDDEFPTPWIHTKEGREAFKRILKKQKENNKTSNKNS